jgi:hypothetical protein
MVIRNRGFTVTGTYRSFHAAAKWTFTEGDQPLRRVRYREQPEGLFVVSESRQKCVSSPVYVYVEGKGADIPDIALSAFTAEMRFSPPCDGQECVSSRPAGEPEVWFADGYETRSAETRRCEACDGDFVPARSWSRFCSAACRVRAHRRGSRRRETENQSYFPSGTP